MNDYTKQANDFLANAGTTFATDFLRFDSMDRDKDGQKRNIFKCTIKNASGEYSTEFGDSTANSCVKEGGRYVNRQAKPIKHPTAYDFLACLTKYNPESFEDFCASLGWDTDSRRAERTYNACIKEWEALSKMFTPEQLEQLQEIS